MADEFTDANLNKLDQWADDVVCPVCHARLRFEAAMVMCTGCARSYPIADGIPVLIPQRASESSTK
jgi:uncharacterized protein YbaR (Trm112 family)